MDLIDEILEAAHAGETTDWEFKSARGGFPGSFWETYSAMANSEGSVSNARLQELLSDHPVDISRMLARLCERGWLVSDNRRRWTTYRLRAGLPAPGDSTHLPGDSTHLASPSPAGTVHDERLQAIAQAVAGRGKVSTAALREAVLQPCTGRYLTAEELAGLLRRTAANLRSRHLASMVKEGRLQLRFPAASNRPDQAYTAVDDR